MHEKMSEIRTDRNSVLGVVVLFLALFHFRTFRFWRFTVCNSEKPTEVVLRKTSVSQFTILTFFADSKMSPTTRRVHKFPELFGGGGKKKKRMGPMSAPSIPKNALVTLNELK